MEFIQKVLDNKEWLFSGVGVVIITGIVGWAFNFKKSKPTQSIKSGKNSTNYQSGNNLTVNLLDGEKHNGK
ncbi:hypothetical protein ACQCVB_19755 [Fictibacillus phosphorivorans]|uniref:hypothetical protein n=1 Tax=Fictibacillus phosphorivorans TaxID=1221500 RepID=UPI003CFB068A